MDTRLDPQYLGDARYGRTTCSLSLQTCDELHSDPGAPNNLENLEEYVEDGHVRRLEQGGSEVSVIQYCSWSNIRY